MPTQLTLKILEKNRADTILLCAVFGGVFSEGVDFPDHLAIGAFIVGPALPLLSIEQELRREFFDNQGLDGFDFAYIQPGMNRVVQAGGRVIRKESDRGFVLLIDKRFTEDRFQNKLPSFWRHELVTTNNPATHLSTFWPASLVLSGDAD